MKRELRGWCLEWTARGKELVQDWGLQKLWWEAGESSTADGQQETWGKPSVLWCIVFSVLYGNWSSSCSVGLSSVWANASVWQAVLPSQDWNSHCPAPEDKVVQPSRYLPVVSPALIRVEICFYLLCPAEGWAPPATCYLWPLSNWAKCAPSVETREAEQSSWLLIEIIIAWKAKWTLWRVSSCKTKTINNLFSRLGKMENLSEI